MWLLCVLTWPPSGATSVWAEWGHPSEGTSPPFPWPSHSCWLPTSEAQGRSPLWYPACSAVVLRIKKSPVCIWTFLPKEGKWEGGVFNKNGRGHSSLKKWILSAGFDTKQMGKPTAATLNHAGLAPSASACYGLSRDGEADAIVRAGLPLWQVPPQGELLSTRSFWWSTVLEGEGTAILAGAGGIPHIQPEM